jgi:acyl-CoA dehydrogenase
MDGWRGNAKKSLAIEEEVTLFKKSIESFAKKEIEDHYSRWEEEGILPRTLRRKIGNAGLLCVDIPEKYGGLGAPMRFPATIIDEFSRLGYTSISRDLTFILTS